VRFLACKQAQLRLALHAQLLTSTTHAGRVTHEIILSPLKYYSTMTCGYAGAALQKGKPSIQWGSAGNSAGTASEFS